MKTFFTKLMTNKKDKQIGGDIIADHNIKDLVKTYIYNPSKLHPKLLGYPIGRWDVRNVTDMSFLFAKYNELFNENINDWIVSNVKNMEGMFSSCLIFNQPLNNWDVSNVTNMKNMFSSCTKFNQPLDKWKIDNVKNMEYMFDYCISYRMSLANWTIGDDVKITDMFRNCPIQENFKPTFLKKTSNIPEPQIQTQKLISKEIPTPTEVQNSKEDETDINYQKMKKKYEELSKGESIIKNEDSYFKYDSILANNHIDYTIKYKEYNGKPYPIITIPKGTMLFTYRKEYENDEYFSKSIFNLKKLNVKETNKNIKNPQNKSNLNFDNLRTFFYPIPYYAAVVSLDFETCDIVCLTEDIDLLCLVSPSPLNKYIYYDSNIPKEHLKYNILYDDFYKCQTDLCININTMRELNIYGYITVVRMDSLNKAKDENIFSECPQDVINVIEQKSLTENSKLSKFAYSNIFNENPVRLRGVPEIVLIPFKHFKYGLQEYTKVQEMFEKKYKEDFLKAKSIKQINNDFMQFYKNYEDMFTFKVIKKIDIKGYYPIDEYSTDNTIKKNIDRTKIPIQSKVIKVSDLVAEYLYKNKHNILQSMQMPLFSMYRPETEQILIEKEIVLDRIPMLPDEYTLKQVNFIDTYAGVPGAHCAFETFLFKNLVSKLSENNSNEIQATEIISKGGKVRDFGYINQSENVLEHMVDQIDMSDNKYINNKLIAKSNKNIYSIPIDTKLSQTMNKYITYDKNKYRYVDEINGIYLNMVANIPMMIYINKNSDNKDNNSQDIIISKENIQPGGKHKKFNKNTYRSLKNFNKTRKILQNQRT